MQKTIKLSLVATTLVAGLYAQNITLAPLEVTSSALKTDELKSTDAVEVYTAKDIEKAHVQNIYEFLNQQTSVITMPNSGNQFNQKIDMRGYGITNGYENIVVKVNGRRLNNIDLVPQLLSSISPNNIQKIEIIKSSGIVENGDGANAGVINIITKKSNQKEITLYGGTYNTFDGTFTIAHQDDKLAYTVAGEAQKNGGIRHIDTNGNKDESKFSNFSFDVAYQALQNLELRANGLTSNIGTWYASSLTQEQYKQDPTQKSNAYFPAVHQLFSSKVIGAGATYDINDELSFLVDYNHEYKTSNFLTYNWEAKYVYNSGNAHFLYENNNFEVVFGTDIFDGDRHTSTNITTKKNIAGYASAKYYLGKSTFKAGYRYEKVDYTYAPTTGSSLSQSDNLHGIELGYNYLLNKQQSLFASYAKGYQAPDIDRFFKGNSFNQFIEPMKTDSFTIGYNDIEKNNKFKVSAYYVHLKDEIYYYANANYLLSKNTNIDKSYKYGVDVYDKYILNNNFNLTLNYNYVQAIIDKEVENGEDYSGNKLPGVSNHNIKAILSYLPNKYATLALTQIWRSKAYAANDFNNNFTQKQDAYNSTDISATYAKDNWEVFAKINNLFNQKNGLWIRDNAIYPVNFTTTALVGLKLKY